MRTTGRRLLAGLALAGMIAAGCGDDDSDDAAEATTTTENLEPEGFVLTGDESSAPSSTVAPDGTEAEIQGLLSFKDVMQMKSLINDRRATGTKCGATQMPPVPALRVNRVLNVAAQKHADDMASKNFFSHTGSDGSTVGQRVTQSGYQWSAVGENIAAGTNTTSVGAAVNQLWTSEPHCKNFMSPNYTEWHAGRANNPSSTYTNYFAIVLAKPL